jgi:hypothetical protein
MQRWIAGVLAVFNISNGLAMLFASSTWWASVPGVPDTGPFNPHFVEDVGAAFLMAGLALGGRAWQHHHAGADLLAVIAPAALALYSAFPNQGEQHA